MMAGACRAAHSGPAGLGALRIRPPPPRRAKDMHVQKADNTSGPSHMDCQSPRMTANKERGARVHGTRYSRAGCPLTSKIVKPDVTGV